MTKTLIRIALSTLAGSALLLGGCDREKNATEQPTAPQTNDGTVPDMNAAAPQIPTGPSNYAVVRDQAGKSVPDIAFTGEDDAATKISDFRGKPLLLNLWATWCAPCVKEMPTLDALAARTAGKLQVITVSQDLKGAEAVDPFFAKHGYKNIKPYLDPEVKLSLGLNAPGLPVTLLIDAKGNEIWRVVGDLDWNGAEARKLLAEAGV